MAAVKMEKIASFTIDHEKLRRGVYVSRRDQTPAGDWLTTFDIRMTEPNRQDALQPKTLHAIEHLAATYLRNHPDWKNKIIYWGPMGCQTGNYLILQGNLEPEDIIPLLIDCFNFISSFEGSIPGATPKDCGNYSFMDPEDARVQSKKYLEEVLMNNADICTKYPE